METVLATIGASLVVFSLEMGFGGLVVAVAVVSCLAGGESMIFGRTSGFAAVTAEILCSFGDCTGTVSTFFFVTGISGAVRVGDSTGTAVSTVFFVTGVSCGNRVGCTGAASTVFFGTGISISGLGCGAATVALGSDCVFFSL